MTVEWDRGHEHFPPTNLQISNVHAGAGTVNVIPGALDVRFNVRFSPASTADEIKARIRAVLDRHRVEYDLVWQPAAEPFITAPGRLVETLVRTIAEVTGLTPELSTGGGTSDGRFLARVAREVVEFGPVAVSMHGADERVRIDDLRRGTLDDEARSKIEETARRLERQFPSFGGINAGGISALEQEGARLSGIDLLIVDPLQSLATGGRALDEELATAVRMLKRVATECDICVLATSVLPALVRDRKDPRPQLDDFGALGAAKQFADVVLGLYRHEMYDSAPDVDGATELLVLKNRNGARGYVDLYFYKQWMRFEDMLEPDR